MLTTKAYAAVNATTPLAPFLIQRREPGPRDILIYIEYCGVCHSDVYFSRGQWPNVIFPVVPGHEIIGRVVQTGSEAARHKIGERVGVGCMVDSCQVCTECSNGTEQFCNNMVPTYSAYERDGKTITYGGYSTRITVDERYVLKIPAGLSPAGAAPLLCAGITTYSPLRHWNVGKGSKVGIIGYGGLGHIATKLAVAMGAEVTVFSLSEKQKADATQAGAKNFVLANDEKAFAALACHFDLILNTASAGIDYNAYVSLLGRDGTLVMIGVPQEPMPIQAMGLLFKRRSIASTLIGGIAETQEMLEFCADHGIESDIEMITIDQVDEAFLRVQKSDVRYRFVIDMASLH